MPLELFGHRITICSALTMMLSQGSLLLLSYYLPVWFQVVKNVSPIKSGVFYMPSVGSQMIASVLTGILSISLLSPSRPLTDSQISSIETGLLHPLCNCRHDINHHLLRVTHNTHAHLSQRNLDYVPSYQRHWAGHGKPTTVDRRPSRPAAFKSPRWHSILNVQPSTVRRTLHLLRPNSLLEPAWPRAGKIRTGSRCCSSAEGWGYEFPECSE